MDVSPFSVSSGTRNESERKEKMIPCSNALRYGGTGFTSQRPIFGNISFSNTDFENVYLSTDSNNENNSQNRGFGMINKEVPVLGTHMINQIEKRPYVCQVKTHGKTSTERQELQKLQYTDDIKRPFVCSWESCKKSFARNSNLRSHELVHTGDRPYVCSWISCKKAFAHNSDLRVHERIHTGDRPYVCSWISCKKAFAQNWSLRVHERIHRGERPYVCRVQSCGKTFVQRPHLRRHEKTHVV